MALGPEEELFTRSLARPKAGLFEHEELIGGPNCQISTAPALARGVGKGPLLGHSRPMYLPPHFEERDSEELAALVDAHPFATLACAGPHGLELAHLPCLREAGPAAPISRVLFHVAAGNALAGLAAARCRMTAVFRGPHCYISPGLFRAPQRQVPSWNYAVVHATGPTAVLDSTATKALIDALCARFEHGRPAPWRPDLTAEGFVDPLMSAIVGIAIDVDLVEGKFKLNQNRSAEDRADVRRGLAKGDESERAVARLMERGLSKVDQT